MKIAALSLLLSSLSTTLLVAPAEAQSLPFGSAVAAPYSTDKTQAILGGSSQLAAILAAQGSSPKASVVASLPSPGGAGPVSSVVQAATFLPVPDDRPDVFGSVALPIRSTPLDARWNTVRDRPATGAAASYASGLASYPTLARLDAINRYVNKRVAYASDRSLHGTDDVWSSAATTLARGSGDCEDYAIAKRELLLDAGFASKDMYLVVLHDDRRAIDHAVLVVHADNRLLVLDNGTDMIADSATMPNYRPILTFSSTRSWTHGYRTAPPQVMLASVEATTRQPTVAVNTVAVAAAVTLPSPSASN